MNNNQDTSKETVEVKANCLDHGKNGSSCGCGSPIESTIRKSTTWWEMDLDSPVMESGVNSPSTCLIEEEVIEHSDGGKMTVYRVL